MRSIPVEERRARLARRHHLAPDSRVDDVVDAAGDIVGLHATDAASVYIAAAARLSTPGPALVERALYDDRTLVRMLGMRRTMFVVPTDVAPIVHAASTKTIGARERKKTVDWLDQAGIGSGGGGWLRRVEAATLAALQARGEAAAAELSTDVPELRQQIPVAVGTKWEDTISASSRVLFLLSADGRIVRGRPRGSWTSTQYRWAPMESWMPGGMAELPIETAQAELVRRWLAAFGPAPAADIKWWTGWTVTEVKRALAKVEPMDVELDGTPGLVLVDDVEPVAAPEPWAALLPALDPTAMGWSEREWYLGPHRPALFDRSGNIGPTVWWDGRIVGGWAQRNDGEIAVRLLEDVGADAEAAVERAADELQAWVGDIRFTPKFRTPLEKELTR